MGGAAAVVLVPRVRRLPSVLYATSDVSSPEKLSLAALKLAAQGLTGAFWTGRTRGRRKTSQGAATISAVSTISLLPAA